MTYEAFEKTYGIALNPQQTAAVQAIHGPVLLLAVPGSGKTTVLVTRLGYMVLAHQIPPQNILTMTYTVAAAGDMKRRYVELFGETAAEGLSFRTINSVCLQIIRHYETTMGRKAFTLVENGSVQAAIIAELVRKQTGEFVAESTVKSVLTNITYIKNAMLTKEQIDAIEIENINLYEVYCGYKEILLNRKWMDFDDQLVYAYQILKRYPDILQWFWKRYPYLCVDEAQDTSKIQHEIIRLLAGHTQNLFMVGDEDQSIYGFRAAYPEALMAFEQTYSGGRVLFMEENYRSTKEIIDVANRFIQQNKQRREKLMVPTRGSGKAVEPLNVSTRLKQYQVLVKQAEELYEETAILYRDNDSVIPLLDLLTRKQIPYRIKQVESTFFHHRIVQDVRDFIAFAHAPEDGELFLKIYYKMMLGITRSMAEGAARRCTLAGQTVLDYLLDLSDLPKGARTRCGNVKEQLRLLKHDTGEGAIRRIRQELAYGRYLDQRNMDAGKLQILEALGAHEASGSELLERLSALEETVVQGSTDEHAPLVLSTIHSSKGLEYKNVILMDVLDGVFPKTGTERDAPGERERLLEEERRLFYVGMTRAKDRLRILCYQREGATASFSSYVFPKKDEEPKKMLPNITLPFLSGPTPRDFPVGGELSHKTLGRGVIMAKSGDIMTVAFETHGLKKLSLSTALRAKQISPKPVTE